MSPFPWKRGEENESMIEVFDANDQRVLRIHRSALCGPDYATAEANLAMILKGVALVQLLSSLEPPGTRPQTPPTSTAPPPTAQGSGPASPA